MEKETRPDYAFEMATLRAQWVLGLVVVGALSLDACDNAGSGNHTDAAVTGGRSGSAGFEATGGRTGSGGAIGTGGAATGGSGTGGSATGGANTGGSATGGANTGGSATGGANTGGSATGGANTGGSATGGANTGGSATGGAHTGGSATGGANTGGSATGGANTGGSAAPTPAARQRAAQHRRLGDGRRQHRRPRSTGGANTGGSATGGANTGGSATGGANTGGSTPSCTTSTWATESVVLQPPPSGSGFASPQGTVLSMMVGTDQAGTVQLFYAVFSPPQVLYARKPAAGSWSVVEPVQTDLFAGHGTTDFAVASDGTAHVFYTIGDTSKALSYRRRSSAGVWTPVLSAMPTIVYAGPSSSAGPDVSAAIVLDGTGNPQSAYTVQVNAPGDPWVPRHATMATGTWQSTLMGISNGNSPDLAVDGADTVHVVLRTGVPAG